jgi:hypothetical protein
MKRLHGGFGIGALLWLRGTVLVVAVSLMGYAGLAQSVRLVPSTSRFAGAVTGTLPSDQGSATTVPLNAPTSVASDVSGNIYIADTGNNCIRRVDTSGDMTVVVGQHWHRQPSGTLWHLHGAFFDRRSSVALRPGSRCRRQPLYRH